MTEIWKEIKGFPDYEVSDHGRCRRGETILKQSVNGPYLRVSLRQNGKTSRERVHVLVAQAFLGLRPSDLHEAAHNDGDSRNNHFLNLRWATHAENMADKIRHGTSPKGINHHAAKLTNEQAKEILSSHGRGSHLARQYGICESVVSEIRSGKAWRHLSTQA